MAYSDFDLKTAIESFGLIEEPAIDMFVAVPPQEPSAFLRSWLDEFAPVALGINSEQARREFIIAPVLAEAKRHAGPEVNVLPGVTFDVDKQKGLTGYCDYLVARSTQLYYVKAPILAVVEAKKENLIAGLGQCVAEMVAIILYNERDKKPTPVVFGCVTSGSNWLFLKLAGTRLSIDRTEYYLHDLVKILGILVSIVRG